MSLPLRIFIGYDSREPIAFHVLAHSIIRRASSPVAIYPLSLTHLKRAYWRERGSLETTEFSLTRFLVPYLCGFEGMAVFMDCDMLCLTDITQVQFIGGSETDVMVCQHEYTPRHHEKFLGQVQTYYPRKNWSSFMVFNNARCEALTPEYVNSATGMMLHRFWWAGDDAIGSLPLEWNYLVDEDGQSTEQPKIIHYTNGGPWFEPTKDCEYADLWRQEYTAMTEGEVVLVRA